MSQSSPSQISETKALKVLSNPARLRLLTLLRTEGPQTVGQLANHLEQAPGSVSYHLKQLSSVHLVEKTEPLSGDDHRMSWWKATDDSLEIASHGFDHSVESAFGRASLSAYSDAYSRFIHSDMTRTSAKGNVVLQHDAILQLSSDEAEELMSELDSVLNKWVKRQEGRKRDEGTNQYALILLGFPWVP